ncbi:MAG: hypothetical protein WKF34_14510 [Pyrinomonadaceae bacterium]
MVQKKRGGSRPGGKAAIITGAIGGSVGATAKVPRCRASLMLVGRSAEKLKEIAGRLGAGDKVATSVADAVDDGAGGAVAAMSEAFDGLDILLANARTEGTFAPIESLTIKGFEAMKARGGSISSPPRP